MLNARDSNAFEMNQISAHDHFKERQKLVTKQASWRSTEEWKTVWEVMRPSVVTRFGEEGGVRGPTPPKPCCYA